MRVLNRSLCLSIRDRLHERHNGDPSDNKRQPGAHDRHAESQPDHFEAGHLLRDHRAGVPARQVRANSLGLETLREGRNALQPAALRPVLVLLTIVLSRYANFPP